MSPVTPAEQFTEAIRARIPLIAVVTSEEERAIRQLLVPAAAAWRNGVLITWSLTSGLRRVGDHADSEPPLPDAPDPSSALDAVASLDEPGLYAFLDFHHHVDSPTLQRKLRDLHQGLPASGKHIVFLGSRFRPPEDLEREILVLDFPPPGNSEIRASIAQAENAARRRGPEGCGLTDRGRVALERAALGLTEWELETALARSLLRHGRLDDRAAAILVQEKRHLIRKGGLIEFCDTQSSLSDVGGLAALKDWLRPRQEAFSEEAADFGIPAPRGILLLGVQGCGKSLVARSVAREWDLPLLRLDVGRVFSRYVGDSETAIRRVIAAAEAASPCVLWIDEIEKGFAGATGEALDAGVSARVLGSFLTWMQEKPRPVFVVATANQIRTLPPELLRRGRFDELFFVDLPTALEREEILHVQLRLRKRSGVELDLPAVAERTDGFTGAELEHVVVEALHRAFADGRRALRPCDLVQAATEIVPISVTLRESIQSMRQWAQGRARRAS